jgi:hypothetical protein
MKQLAPPQKVYVKPSELPENTVIEDYEYGKFVKETDHLWLQLHAEKPDVVSDLGYSNSKKPAPNFVSEKSDEYFKDFDIVSVPMGWYPPDTQREIVVWFDLARQVAVRRTTVTEIVEDDDTTCEEELEFAKPIPAVWHDIPGHPTYETCMNASGAISVRNKKTRDYKQRNKAGFFILYKKGKREWWCGGELGTLKQIIHFYKTGEVGANV